MHVDNCGFSIDQATYPTVHRMENNPDRLLAELEGYVYGGYLPSDGTVQPHDLMDCFSIQNAGSFSQKYLQSTLKWRFSSVASNPGFRQENQQRMSTEFSICQLNSTGPTIEPINLSKGQHLLASMHTPETLKAS